MKFSIMFVMAILTIITISPAYAKCDVTDKLCIMAEIKETADKIEDQSWRDKSLRELAKSYTSEGHEDKAIALIAEIQTPDTKAMTIRGIGMAAADNNWKDKKRYEELFRKLAAEAEKIEHKPSYAIAYTYIAMAQAFARDDIGAMATAKGMEDAALRQKALGETAEIQAERGDYNAALASIKEIGSPAFRDKAFSTIAAIFTKKGQLPEAYSAAGNIENSFRKAEALQNIINYGNVEENLQHEKSQALE